MYFSSPHICGGKFQGGSRKRSVVATKIFRTLPPPPSHTHKAINNYEYPEHVNKLCRRVLLITSLLANLMGKYVLPFTRKNIFVFQTEGGC